VTLSDRTTRLLVTALIVGVAYYAGVWIGFATAFPGPGSARRHIFWPPNVILLAAFLVTPVRWWWPCSLTAFAAHLLAHAQLGIAPAVMALPVQFAGNVLQAVLAACTLRRLSDPPWRVDTLRSMIAVITVAGIAAPALASAGTAYAYVLAGWAPDYASAWGLRFLANATSTITLAPLLLPVAGQELRGRRDVAPWRAVEFVAVLVGLLVGGALVSRAATSAAQLPLLYAPLPLVLWAAVRFGPPGVSIALTATLLLFVGQIVSGPSVTPVPVDNAIALVAFLVAIAVPLLLLAALVEERRQTEDSLRRVQADLTHAARVTTMGQLVASIAHEINQPLAAIVTNAKTSLRRIAAGSLDTQELREVLQDVADDGKRASEVIQQIRRLVKKSPAQTAPLKLNAAIQEVIALALGELMRHRVSLRTELADDLPPVRGDRVQLQQVVLNLIMNSIEAMRDVDDRSRELIVQSRRNGAGFVVVAVRDSGPGLGPGERDAIFNAFYTTKPGGMGMGLSVSRTIVEAHGGRLWASPDEPRGATLQFSLPTA
jgi:signal transduction histidine kinase